MMKKMVILAALSASLFGCTPNPATGISPWCQFVGPVDSTIVAGIAKVAQCTNPTAILASFQAVEKCTVPTPAPSPAPGTVTAQLAGPISTICTLVAPAIVSTVVPLVEGAVIPATWGCNTGASVATLTTDVQALCGLIPAVQVKAK